MQDEKMNELRRQRHLAYLSFGFWIHREQLFLDFSDALGYVFGLSFVFVSPNCLDHRIHRLGEDADIIATSG